MKHRGAGTQRGTEPEWFASAVLAAVGSTVFGRFEEKTPLRRRLSKWAFYFSVTAALSHGSGRPWTFIWVLGYPAIGMAFHMWWCGKHGIDPLTAEPKERYYELRGWGKP